MQPLIEERLRGVSIVPYSPCGGVPAEASTGAFEGGIFGDSLGATWVGIAGDPFGLVRLE